MNTNEITQETVIPSAAVQLSAFDNTGNMMTTINDNKDNPEVSFAHLGIDNNILKAIEAQGFRVPTPIQRESIPFAIKGGDVLALARTGSGKTLAFGIPMLQRLSKIREGRGLVLVPTRELALQVEQSIQSIGRSQDLRSVVLIGGASMDKQRVALKKNPAVIIATPGRLMDHIDRRTIKLDNLEILVLDEADRMLDMGFAKDIKKILKSVPARRQTMLFSATMPKEIEALAENLLDNPARVETDRSGVTPDQVSHELFLVKGQSKSRLLAYQLQQSVGPVLVFTRTKRMASKLTAKVNNMGFSAAEIHSNRSLGQRRNALEGFKRGDYNILIATDIAARGIDVTGIELVVNYDMPANSEDYVHRIGRTGRAGRSGHAISFVTSEQTGSVRSLERFMDTQLSYSSMPILPSEKKLVKEAQFVSKMTRKSEQRLTEARKTRRPGREKQTDVCGNEAQKIFAKKISSGKSDSVDGSKKKTYSKRTKPKSKGFRPGGSGESKPFYSSFKKKSSNGKKRSVGQGPKRKRAPKRK